MVKLTALETANRSLECQKDFGEQKAIIQEWVQEQTASILDRVTAIEELDNEAVDIPEYLRRCEVVDIDIIDGNSGLGVVAFAPIDIPPELLSTDGHFLIAGWDQIAQPPNCTIKNIEEFDMHSEVAKLVRRWRKRNNSSQIETLRSTEKDRSPIKTYILSDGLPRKLAFVYPFFLEGDSRLRTLILEARRLQPSNLEILIDRVFEKIAILLVGDE